MLKCPCQKLTVSFAGVTLAETDIVTFGGSLILYRLELIRIKYYI